MITVSSYPVAVAMCVITMLCWGSWANTQKMLSGKWGFQLFYWDYSVGVLLFSLALALTAGSLGDGGRSFLPDISQANIKWLGAAFVGGAFSISQTSCSSRRRRFRLQKWGRNRMQRSRKF